MDKVIDKLAQKIDVKDMIKANNEPEDLELKETMHTESVKVYRNVQAILDKQTEDINKAIESIEKRTKSIRIISIWGLILLLANLGVGVTVLALLLL